ncbi:uncharacterized protein MKK02DRAFT_38876 [Dioszegia hungarica]|uniref:Inhibitor I9 domain-containing protein n=1 Tax=Dioszegia hungarica TaxID=4972 RepID=A0AA38H5D1_9TREE|nr:uncharacterized protein MKK02DRAFT_38876 [Dioszegia hungarica]KAI9634203.1 hypothetical protein MKK02DRAFT_38876 [Dioszegia hungarica]
MADHKNVIVTFHKTSSPEDRSKLLDELKSKGAQIVKDDNLNSPIMPFVTVSMPDEHFDALQSSSLQGHDVVKNVEKDQEMRIQA